MSKKLFFTATAAVMIMAASCGQASKAQVNETKNDGNTNVNVMASLKKVLLDEVQYFDVALKKSMYLKDYWTYFSENMYNGPMRQDFAVVDMDGDGVPEVVLMYDPGELKVFRVEKGTIYGYDFSFRGMNGIKADGTFYWSNDAGSSGVGKQTFSGTKTETKKLADSNQDNKTDAEWLDFNETNVKLKVKN